MRPESRGYEGSLLVARGRCIVNAMCAKGEKRRGRRVSGLKKLEGKGGRVKWEENGRYIQDMVLIKRVFFLVWRRG